MRKLVIVLIGLPLLYWIGSSVTTSQYVENELFVAESFGFGENAIPIQAKPTAAQSTTTSLPTTTIPLTKEEPSTTTTTLIDRADPVFLRIPSINLEVPIDSTGPVFGKDEWYPAGNRVEWYASTELIGPGEIGPAFILGHSNWSRARNEGNAFFNLFDTERYDNDISVAENDQIFVDLADGNVCVFNVIDPRKEQYMDLPGLPLALSPAKYVPKLTDWTYNTYRIIDATKGISRIYLFGSYPGPEGNEYEKYADGSIHAVYAAYVVADLVECTEQTP